MEKEQENGKKKISYKKGPTLFGNILDDFLPLKIKPTMLTVDDIYKNIKKRQMFKQLKLVRKVGHMNPL